MMLKTLFGKIKNKNVSKYIIDWDAPSLSKFQFNIKQFLRPYWKTNICYEEFPVYGTLMHIDIFNATKKIAIEVSGNQHIEFTPYFHNNRCNFLSQIKRDINKIRFCEINDIKLIEIYPEDLNYLSKEYFIKKFGIYL